MIIEQLNVILAREGTMIFDMEKLLPVMGEPQYALVPLNDKTRHILTKES
ncbi:MAG: hypothetical protein AAB599_03770 [Patescibacteria group bacterium]